MTRRKKRRPSLPIERLYFERRPKDWAEKLKARRKLASIESLRRRYAAWLKFGRSP